MESLEKPLKLQKDKKASNPKHLECDRREGTEGRKQLMTEGRRMRGKDGGDSSNVGVLLSWRAARGGFSRCRVYFVAMRPTVNVHSCSSQRPRPRVAARAMHAGLMMTQEVFKSLYVPLRPKCVEWIPL